MKKAWWVAGVIFIHAGAAFSQDVCAIALQSNAFNTSDEIVSNKIAFEKKSELCSKEYSNKEEFQSAVRNSGFSLSYAGVGVGYSGGKASSGSKVDFQEESFCSANQDQFAQEYFSNTRVKVADVALKAWTDCINTTKSTSLWLDYDLPNDGTGMTGKIYRTISIGKTNLEITDLQVQPVSLNKEVKCTIENIVFDSEYFNDGKKISTNTTEENFSCTKPTNKSVRIGLGTDGGSLAWIEMPSVEAKKLNELDNLNASLLSLTNTTSASIENLNLRLNQASTDLARQEAKIASLETEITQVKETASQEKAAIRFLIMEAGSPCPAGWQRRATIGILWNNSDLAGRIGTTPTGYSSLPGWSWDHPQLCWRA